MGDWETFVAQDWVESDVALAPWTTYKVGGPARWLATPKGLGDLEVIGRAAVERAVPVVVLGRGSNVVISDAGFDGIVVRLGDSFGSMRWEGGEVVAGAAVSLPRLARTAVATGRGGLEFFVGIPGSVGGAVHQNAGCHGRETKDVLVSASVWDLRRGELTSRSVADLGLGYRRSDLRDHEVVVEARFVTTPGDPEDGERLLREITRWRREHQPGGTLNAGSVFKNPPGDSAGRIIDALGLKGLRRGRVYVSERHANFFVAEPGASAADIKGLVDDVIRRVAEATGIVLEPEIRFVGGFDEEER